MTTSATYTVQNVQPGEEWTSEHGRFQPYRLRLDGIDKTVHLNTKAGSAAPMVGQVLELILEPHPKFDDALKAKKSYQGGSQNGGRGRDPKEQRRIAAQHAQKCAVDILRLAVEHSDHKLPSTVGDVVAQIKVIAASLLTQVEEAGA